VERVAHPFQHLVVELELPQQLGELRFERLLADVFAPARGRVALALISVPGAMIIDVARLLDLPNYRAAAGMAGDQSGKGESMFAAFRNAKSDKFPLQPLEKRCKYEFEAAFRRIAKLMRACDQLSID
jgi:hypothetical protein